MNVRARHTNVATPEIGLAWSLRWLPRHLVERRTPLPAPGEEEVFLGTLLRLDIAGFSARADKVAGPMRHKSEDLAAAVDQAFQPVFRAVDRHGGSVAGLEGDAVLALFRGSAHASRAQRALDEIHASRPDLHRAIATGEIHALHLEGGEQRAEVLYGPALLALEQSEDRESTTLVAFVPPEPEGPLVAPSEADLLRFVPPPLRGETIEAANHRRVVAGFVAVPMVDAAAGYRVLAEEAASHAVTLLKVRAEGGEIVALGVAGAPRVHENDPLRAVSWVVRVRDRLLEGQGIRARAGMADGPVIALVVGDESRASWDVLGDAVNIAFRLLEVARPGEILATANIVDRAGDVSATAAEAVNLKGKNRPVAARKVQAIAPAPQRTLDIPSLRAKERAALLQAFRKPGAFAIIGAAGMGKRRLWQDALAAEPGWRVLRATCRDWGTVQPLAAFVGTVQRVAGEGASRSAVQAALSTLPGMSERAAGVLLAMLGEGAPQVAATTSALRQLVAGACGAGPTVLVVEDLQWADEDTRAVVAALAADAARLGLRLLVTARPRTQLPGGVAALVLPPLDKAMATQLVQAVVGDTALLPETLGRVLERGEGNPRDLVALAEAAKSGIERLPESMEAWYADRIDALEQPAREVLERAAVLGRTTDLALLRRMSSDVPRAEEGLGALLAARLLHPEGNRASFDREAIRELTYMRMTTARRRKLHGRAGALLVAHAEAGAPIAPEVSAWHLARSETPALALPSLLEAAKRARMHGRPRLALSHAEQAVRIARQHATDQLPAAWRSAGDAYLLVGRGDLALEALRNAGEGAHPAKLGAILVAAGHAREALAAVEGDPSALGAAVRARAYSLLGDRRVTEAHQEALRAAGSDAERARALRFYGADLARGDRHRAAAEVLEESARAARAAHDHAARAESLEALGASLAILGDAPRALAHHREALALRERLHAPEGVATSLRLLGRAESLAGDHATALGHLHAARSLLREAGHESKIGRVELGLAEVRWRRGEHEHARTHLQAVGETTGRTRATHRLLSALVAESREGTVAFAREAVDAARADRWRAGEFLAKAVIFRDAGDAAALVGVTAELERCEIAEFTWLARQWCGQLRPHSSA